MGERDADKDTAVGSFGIAGDLLGHSSFATALFRLHLYKIPILRHLNLYPFGYAAVGLLDPIA
jgi:hypothetical protein